MCISMAFYSLFISILVFLLADYRIGGREKPRFFRYLGILFFVAVLIFRFDVGWDYPNYYNVAHPTLGDLVHFEPICKCFYYITDFFHFPPLFFMIVGTVTCYFIFRTLLQSSDSVLLGLLTCLAFYLGMIFGGIRQGMALSVILFAYRYLTQGKWLSYILMCIVAGLMHYSAFVCLLFPFLYKFLSSSFRLILVLSVLVIGGKVMLADIIEQIGYYEGYLTNTDLSGGSILPFVYIAVLLILYILAMLRKGNESNKRLIRLALIGTAFPFLLGGHIGTRLCYYFMIYICVFLPNIAMQYRAGMRVGFAMCLITLFFGVLYVGKINPIKNPYMPYRTIFTVDLDHPIFKHD